MSGASLLSLLSLIILLPSSSLPNPLSLGHCSDNLLVKWPGDLSNGEITWAANSREGSPVYRLVFADPQAARKFLPGSTHSISLVAEQVNHIHRFLISVLEDEDKESCGPGELRSRGLVSEPVSYSCPQYLVDKPGLTNITRVDFEWTAPQCGCVKMSSEVLDEKNNMFTFQNDNQNALRFYACVSPNEVSVGGSYLEEGEDDAVADIAVVGAADEKVDDAKVMAVVSRVAAEDSPLDAEAALAKALEKSDRETKQWRKQFDRKRKWKRRHLRQHHRRKHMRRNGLARRWCCRKGKVSGRKGIIGNTVDICGEELATQVLELATKKFGTQSRDMCLQIYQKCCEASPKEKRWKRKQRSRRMRGKSGKRRKEEERSKDKHLISP